MTDTCGPSLLLHAWSVKISGRKTSPGQLQFVASLNPIFFTRPFLSSQTPCYASPNLSKSPTSLEDNGFKWSSRKHWTDNIFSQKIHMVTNSLFHDALSLPKLIRLIMTLHHLKMSLHTQKLFVGWTRFSKHKRQFKGASKFIDCHFCQVIIQKQ